MTGNSETGAAAPETNPFESFRKGVADGSANPGRIIRRTVECIMIRIPYWFSVALLMAVSDTLATLRDTLEAVGPIPAGARPFLTVQFGAGEESERSPLIVAQSVRFDEGATAEQLGLYLMHVGWRYLRQFALSEVTQHVVLVSQSHKWSTSGAARAVGGARDLGGVASPCLARSHVRRF